MDVGFHSAKGPDVAHRIRAVVGEKENQRIVELAAFLEKGIQFPHVLINVFDHRKYAGDSVFLLVAVFRFSENGTQVDGLIIFQQFLWDIVIRTVRCIGWDVGEKRFSRILGCLHEFDGGIRINIGAVAFGFHLFAVAKEEWGRCSAFGFRWARRAGRGRLRDE